MNSNQTKDLFTLQTELVDMKVDMAASKAIDRVVEQIVALRSEMHYEIGTLRNEMHVGFASLDKRVVAIETRLGMIDERKKVIYDRTLDYIFKAGYGILTFTLGYFAYLLLQNH